jgi:hypothetical protein
MCGGTNNSGTAPGITYYVPFQLFDIATMGLSLGEGNGEVLMPVSGFIKDLRVKSAGPPGAGETYRFTLRINEASTPLTATIAGAVETTACDLSHSVRIIAGDRFCMMIESSLGSGNPGWRLYFGVEFNPD